MKKDRLEGPSRVGRGSTPIFTLSLILVACGEDPREEGAAPPPGVPTGLSEAPLLVVGERPADPNHQLHRVITPFLLPGGGIGVPLGEEGTIRIFDEDGAFVRSLGSSGEGPGEFMGLSGAWARGDTVEAYDSRLNRLTRFGPEEAPTTIPVESVGYPLAAVPGLRDGGWVLYGVKEVLSSGRDLIVIHRFAPNGSHLAELGELFWFRRHFHDGGRGPDPISPRPLVRTRGNRVYLAETLTPRITELDLSTGQTRSLEWEPERALSSAEAIAVAREEASVSGRAYMDEAWTLASFDALEGDEEVSVFWDFLIDGEEFLWVREYDPRRHSTAIGGLFTAGSGGEWSIRDLEGRRLARVIIPEDLEPLRIDSDRLIGVRRDEFDVESVRIYRIERGGSP